MTASRRCPLHPLPTAGAGLLLAVLLAARPASAGINLHNKCAFALGVYARSGSNPTYPYYLKPGAQQWLDFGPANLWPAGVIWASKSNNTNNGQATEIEFTIGGDMGNGLKQDFYDISLVNAYNHPVLVTPLNPPSVSGNWCGSPSCTISSLSGFCKLPNYLTGKDPACINKDGPGLVATTGTKAFKTACPKAYSYSKDDATSTFSCKWGTNYNVIFCP
ncbi:hypothetical protein HYH03_002903 [Edaphochlamys debaryana]|uniref:Thaumatin-like protein n=1 Tax=Edaphochlamys debaryana TaxID=47281 RepID=A0A835YEB5_9CHLO|nr:hypothetical protein HYH03_002903 [Edaphochlamys debaryana]|eukprot:KAG2499326.1 hypothetical protein HYH03_002903 [Edaphochlamys debaryana]